MYESLEVLYHSCVKISIDKIIYVDPYGIKECKNDADYIFITHSHYDHFSPEDIEKVRNSRTKIIVTKDLVNGCLKLNFDVDKILAVEPNNSYEIDNIKIITVPAYNKLKPFHLKSKGWVGYVITVDGVSYYITGDTDITPESLEIKCDVLFVPVGATYTMNAVEAANLANCIKPKLAIPIHYGSIVGNKKDAEKFVSMLKDIKYKILMQ